MEIFKVRLTTLTPIHIGTGLCIEPTDFFVDTNKRCLHVVDFEKLCSHLTKEEIETFKRICLEGDRGIIKLYDFMDKISKRVIRTADKALIKTTIPVSRDFIIHYTKREHFNRFEILRTYRLSEWGRPIIPGPSVKGAIRTAILNYIAKRLRDKNPSKYLLKNKKYDSRQLERDLLRYTSPQNDPFSTLKISDFHPTKAKIRILYAINVRKDGKEGSGPYQILEVIMPDSVFTGKITIVEKEGCKKITKRLILESLDCFYSKVFDEESKIVKKITEVNMPAVKKGFSLIRLGKHSGAESVTIEGFRAIRVRKQGGRTLTSQHATTLWLASESRKKESCGKIYSFGWAVIGVV